MQKKKLLLAVLIILSLFLLLCFGLSKIAVGKTVFFDDFEDGIIADYYAFSGEDLPQTHAGQGEWIEQGGVFSQTSVSQGDECHAVIMDQSYPELITILTKVRIDSWVDGDFARGGLALRVGEDTGRGYNFLFHNNQSTMQFLNDQSAWGSSDVYEFEIEEWYWMQFHIDADGMLHGKIWGANEPEPAGWMLEQPAFGDLRPWQGGYPAINGGTSPHGGSVTVSFDNVQIWDQDGPSPLAIVSKHWLTTTWAVIK